MGLFDLPLTILIIAAFIAMANAKGDKSRGIKIFFLALLGILVISAGICFLILSNMNLGNMH